MRGDLLDGGRPKRLIRHQGTWTLEVVRLVPLDSSVFEPAVQRIDGAEAILAHLQRTSQGRPFARPTHQLLQSISGDDSRSFDAVDGEWIPSPVAPSYIKELSQEVRRKDRTTGVAELVEVRAELLIQRTAYLQLQERVAQLEKRLEHGYVAVPAGASRRPAADAGAFVDSSPGLEPSGIPAEAEAVAPRGPSIPAPVPAPERPTKILELPTVREIGLCLQPLVGDELQLDEARTELDCTSTEISFYASFLQDDAGRSVGIIIADLAATVRLGGSLMMLPQMELEQQTRSGKASEDVVAAMSEVFNMLGGPINAIDGNEHVRATEIKPFGLDDQSQWVGKPRKRLDMTDGIDGRMSVLSR